MKKLVIITLFCLTACKSNDTKQQLPIYDGALLKAFVLSIPQTSEQRAIHQLDSILQTASTDSMVFRQTVTFLETPFASPNSSYRNQKLYIRILQSKERYAWYNDDEKKIAADRIKLLEQN